LGFFLVLKLKTKLWSSSSWFSSSRFLSSWWFIFGVTYHFLVSVQFVTTSLKLVQRYLVLVFVFGLLFLVSTQIDIKPSPVIDTMVEIEELDEDMSPEGALEYLVEFVFPKETDIPLTFFEYNGIEDLMTSCL
jgi:hypothetical protein